MPFIYYFLGGWPATPKTTQGGEYYIPFSSCVEGDQTVSRSDNVPVCLSAVLCTLLSGEICGCESSSCVVWPECGSCNVWV